MKELKLNQFKDLKHVLKNKEKFQFTITYHDSREVRFYRIVNEEFSGLYDPLDFVSIDIFKDKVELHVVREGSYTHISEFSEREKEKLYYMKEIEQLEFAIIKAVDKWNNNFYS